MKKYHTMCLIGAFLATAFAPLGWWHAGVAMLITGVIEWFYAD